MAFLGWGAQGPSEKKIIHTSLSHALRKADHKYIFCVCLCLTLHDWAVPGCRVVCYKWYGWFCSQGVLAVSGGWRGTPSCRVAGCPFSHHRWSCTWGTVDCRLCYHCCTWQPSTADGTDGHIVLVDLLTLHATRRPRLGLYTQRGRSEPPYR